MNSIDPNGEATLSIRVKAEGKIGGIVRNVAERLTGNDLIAGGVNASVGLAVSFPAFDGAKFDAGVFGSAGATDLDATPAGDSLPSLPGAKAGVAVGIAQGSVGDLAGRDFSVQAQANIGKSASNAVVNAVAGALPNGQVKNFVNGPVRGAANGLLGLVGSVGMSHGDDGGVGVELGLSKGVNIGASGDVEVTKVCGVRDGCR